MDRLSNLKYAEGSRKNRKRVGRGEVLYDHGGPGRDRRNRARGTMTGRTHKRVAILGLVAFVLAGGAANDEQLIRAIDQAPASREAYLMEVNGRFWGSLQLAVDAGVDFPALLVRAARGERVEPVTEYRVGIRARWLWGDVDHLLARLRGSVPSHLSADLPSRRRGLLDFLRWRSGDRWEVLRLSDLKPFVRESAAWLRGAGG